MSIIRSYHDKKHPYVMASKASAWDPNLDLDCVGLWLRILTRPDDWTIRITELAKVCKCDKKKIYRIINILIKEGYAYKQQPKDKDNKFEKVEYIVFEKKMTEDEIKEMFPQSAFGVSGFRESGTYSTNPSPLDKSKEELKDIKEGRKSPPFSAAAESLYTFFLANLKERYPNFKTPNRDKWMLELDRLLRIDKRDFEEVKECISWLKNDLWFAANILSPSALRKSYDKIFANMLMHKDKDRIRCNREWALEKKEKNKDHMKALSFDKDYARNTPAGKEVPFNLPVRTFREALIGMFGGTYHE